MSYKVKLNIFEGPLDLLLFLIKKDKIDIYDIPVAVITDQYLEYMNLMKMLDLEIAGEFLVMAATLIHIKSKMLLPEEDREDETEEEDPREELVRRLLEYKKYKEAAAHLKEMQDLHSEVFLRRGSGMSEKIISDDGTEYFEASLFDLISSFKKILTGVTKEAFHKVFKDEFSVDDKIHEIYHMLAKQPSIYFSSLFIRAGSKDEVIVIFLAILELMKRSEIFVVQKGHFEEIEVMRNPELSSGGFVKPEH
ncbi:MAG: segregation/condensation protein A [Candidatus Omnitrophota bacterium]|nr:segregation/condensation protein A [Candidatus Omnitrophota bacterium]